MINLYTRERLLQGLQNREQLVIVDPQHHPLPVVHLQLKVRCPCALQHLHHSLAIGGRLKGKQAAEWLRSGWLLLWIISCCRCCGGRWGLDSSREQAVILLMLMMLLLLSPLTAAGRRSYTRVQVKYFSASGYYQVTILNGQGKQVGRIYYR